MVGLLSPGKKTESHKSYVPFSKIGGNFNYRKADDKIFVCKFSKNVKSKLYHIENSKTRGQTV